MELNAPPPVVDADAEPCRAPTGQWPRTLGIIGAAGTVGSALAYRLVLSAAAEQVFVGDERRDVLAAHVIDVGEAAVLSGVSTRLTAVPVAEMPQVDVLIVTAAVREDPEAGRRVYAAANCAIVTRLLPHILRIAGDRGVILLVTNPVDVVAEFLRRCSGLVGSRIIGYSLNDGVRFRVALGRALGIDPARIEASVLGEHGGIQVPRFGCVRVDARPVVIDAAARTAVCEELRGWFRRWADLRAGRSSGWCTACGTELVLRAMAIGAELPLSVASDEWSFLASAFVTLPAVLSRTGVARLGACSLDRDERSRLQAAATAVRSAVDEVRCAPESDPA